jgi:uroporphyrinogen decarboxylase
MEEHRGPITTWEEFERYPWPDPKAMPTSDLEWLQENLPDDMCIIARGGAHFCEHLCWLMGYETLCYALYDQRELVAAIRDRLEHLYSALYKRILEFDRVKLVWGSDDMGFKTGTLISPGDLREFVLPGHKQSAQAAHAAGRPYLLHSCGNLKAIMDDLIDDVGIDAEHSFEDAIQNVVSAKERYGDRIALLGGIDVDFLCRASEEQVRRRVRHTLEKCMPGGGYCLGTGNSVANYIPIENYLAMLDEGRRFSA